MRIRMVTNLLRAAIMNGVRLPNAEEEVDIDDASGAELIKRGYAVAVETAEVEAPENAAEHSKVKPRKASE